MNMALLLSVICLGLCLIFFFYFRWYIMRNISAARLLDEYRAEVVRLIAEIDTATDRDSRLVEERVKALRQIIEDTDRRISVYIQEAERSRRGEAMYASLGRGIRVALDSGRAGEVSSPPAPAQPAAVQPAATAQPEQAQVPPATGPEEKDENLLFSPSDTPKQRPEREKRLKPKKTGSSSRGQGTDKRKPRERIAEMAARGLAPAEIASRLNMSMAEVELALNLMSRPDGN